MISTYTIRFLNDLNCPIKGIPNNLTLETCEGLIVKSGMTNVIPVNTTSL